MRLTTLLIAGASAWVALASPSRRAGKFLFTGANEAGGEFGGSTFPGVLGKDYIWPDPNAIDTLIGKGMNTFRVAFRMERAIPDKLTGAINEEYFAGLASTVSHITGKGAYAIIDPHNYGRYYGNIITDVSGFGSWWSTVAKRFANNSRVIFDTNNEYHDMENSLVAKLNQAAIDAIRGAGATSQSIFVEGNSWSGAWTWISSGNGDALKDLKDPSNKIIYEMHQYLDSDGSGTSEACVSSTIGKERIQAATKWLKDNKKKGIIGEMAGGANQQCIDAIKGELQYLLDNSDVWTGWLWWAAGPWWGDYMYSIEPPSGTAYTKFLPIRATPPALATIRASTPPPPRSGASRAPSPASTINPSIRRRHRQTCGNLRRPSPYLSLKDPNYLSSASPLSCSPSPRPPSPTKPNPAADKAPEASPTARAAAMERPSLTHHEPHTSALHCCCGRDDCAFLKRNCSVLETVEKDVHTAAQLGQALLARHEAYMADAERDRLELNARIERLEMDKQELEAENAIKIEENRSLLDQLEALNNNVTDSDTRVKSLEVTLVSSQQAVRRLEAAAIHAADAERHLAMLEQEQAQLHEELQTTREDARSHSQRFKEAQRGIMDMQDQLERMESEARQERQRHEEVIGRMERQREVEKQLDTAAGRLKGAAATKTFQEQKNGSSIVGHFVRDLLQDNANLQLGMAELRELLLNSNDEIQGLREQLSYHQPLLEESGNASNLQAELEPLESPEPPRVSQELHIHHHYHAAPKTETRKIKKKRQGLTPGIFSPPSLSNPGTPVSSGQWRLGPAPTAPALLSRSSKDPVSAMALARQSWSAMSEHPSDFASSVPSSPRSNQRSSMFDPGYFDSEVPTSPTTSCDPMSPTWRASHRKGPSDASTLNFQPPPLQIDVVPGTPPTPQASRQHYFDDTIREEDEEEEGADSHLEPPDLVGTAPSIDESSTIEGSDVSMDEYMVRPRIHQAVSHESIMSLSGGLDIHTLKVRPSQLTLRPLGGAQAVVTGVMAQPTLSRGSAKRSSVALRDALPNMRSVSGPLARSLSPNPPGGSQGNSSGTLGKWVGWRPWGGPSPNAGNAAPKATDKEIENDWNRAPGINQPGAIPGFQKYWAAQRRRGAPARVTTESVDHDALLEGLQE
ncbi:hypothetical protein G7046_g3063 [Stylonectria norvegica]|nr:hypothetical protein G7046_g3063 [Stylonectria norvegica]